MDRKDVAIAIALRDGKVLICKRRQADTFGGLWEFPGGKREPGETLEQCLARELWEELRLRVRPIETLTPIEHDYPMIRVLLVPFLCECSGSEPIPLACEQAMWVAPADLPDYPFPPANSTLIEQVIGRLARDAPRRSKGNYAADSGV